jgi:TRAP-type C4-dicarboxylate transport system permease small subunit
VDSFIRVVKVISRLCGYFAAGLIALGVVVVCEMVFVRYVLNENTIWQTDFVPTAWSLRLSSAVPTCS